MEEVIDELRERNQTVPVPLELPEMDEIIDAEEQILVSLDRNFREFLLTVSDVVYGSIEPVTVCDPQSHTYLPEVAAQAWSLGVPRNLIPVCEFNGQYYCANEEGEIVHWQEGELLDQSWSNVWYWAADVWLDSYS